MWAEVSIKIRVAHFVVLVSMFGPIWRQMCMYLGKTRAPIHIPTKTVSKLSRHKD